MEMKKEDNNLKMSNENNDSENNQLDNMIAAAACRIAEERGFNDFSVDVDPEQDWVKAKEEVSNFLDEN